MHLPEEEYRRRCALPRSSLHSCLEDPILGSVNFLNEVIDQYPDAISFAPGAPAAVFFEELDLQASISRYVDYLIDVKKWSAGQVRRHLYQYGPSQGQINELIAEGLRVDQGIQVEPAAIVITVGCQEAMLLTLRALFGTKQDVLAVVDPCFVGITGAARLLDVDVLPVSESEGEIDFAQLALTCGRVRRAGRRIRALYVAPDFANPSGTNLNVQARERLLAEAERHDFVLLEDCAYGFTAPSDCRHPSLKALDRGARVVQLGTFAKICMPGARVGFAVADQIVGERGGKPRYLAHDLAMLKSMVTVNTSPICQAIVAGMILEHGGSLASLGNARAWLYRRNLGLLLGALENALAGAADGGVTWNTPAGGFFVRMRLPVVVDDALLRIAAAEYGVLFTPMTYFYVGNRKSHELRLSCSYLTPEEITEGVARLSRFLRDPRAN